VFGFGDWLNASKTNNVRKLAGLMSIINAMIVVDGATKSGFWPASQPKANFCDYDYPNLLKVIHSFLP
jgi:hypothetical protein